MTGQENEWLQKIAEVLKEEYRPEELAEIARLIQEADVSKK